MLMIGSGCEPLTPDDIAEVIVFNAGRRENVVVADTLIFPNHQASSQLRSSYPLAFAFLEPIIYPHLTFPYLALTV